MSIGSKIESKGMFATSVFNAIVGVIFLVLLPMSGFAPHIGLLGVFSLVAAYGLLRKRAWSFWVLIVLLFSGTTFALFMMYDVWTKEYLVDVVMIAYMILTWVFTAYAATKRKVFEA